MTEYTLVKSIHVTAVVATFLSFTVRGVWMFAGSPMLERRWVRIVPHLVDTVLLASGAYMAWTFYRYPLVDYAWLNAKLIGLVVYIVLGTIALKRGRTRRVRLGAFIAALCVFAYIVHTAVTKAIIP
ncbi:MAG TPA: SirB2 family protein [Gammaproteobacteria bacterium]|nr:SirB2 family protein [Gammaproteobacteria bacterium]